MKRIILLGITIIATVSYLNAQNQKQYKINAVAFYNLENLFDTIDSKNPDTHDTEFTPLGKKKYNTKIYNEKLQNLSSVILKLGTEKTQQPPAICGVAEVENASVLIDLINKTEMKKYGYDYVHVEGPDERGVDVAFLYRKSLFKVTSYKAIPLTFKYDDDKTRDHLLVTGLLDGEEIHVIVNHWPSRAGGEKRSRPKRNAAGDKTREIVDSLLRINENAKIIVMGDLNDDPVNESVKLHLRARMKKDNLKKGDLFNPYAQLFKNGIGSNAYHDKWNLFDQIIISQGLMSEKDEGYKFYTAHVYNHAELKQRKGAFKGYPWRTYVGDTYMGGYSDHFPSFIYLIKEIK